MRRLFLPALLGLALGGVLLLSIPASADAPLNDLDAFLGQARRDWGVPGMAVAVVKDGRVVFLKGYGVRTQGRPGTVDANTAFQLASVTKTFTAAAVGAMVDEGKLGWDDPVLGRLPGFALADSYATTHATVRDLLAHRTGLPAFTGDLLGTLGYNRTEVMRRARFIEPAGSFREAAGYSNLGYTLAGLLVGEAAGSSWEAVVRARLLEPLGMRRTGLVAASLNRDPNAAAPHLAGPGGPVPIASRESDGAFAPAGAMTSTASDMAVWMRMLLGGGSLGGKQVLRPETVRELFRPAMAADPGFAESAPIGEESGFDYALGWAAYHHNGRKVLEKGGALAGVRTIVTLVPSERLGVAVLANLNLTLLPEAARARVLEAYLGPAGRDLQAAIRRQGADIAKLFAAQPARTRPGPPAAPLEAYTGVYESELYGRLAVVREGAGLAARGGPACHRGSLTHQGRDAFGLDWGGPNTSAGTATFVLDASGRATRLETENYGVFGRVEQGARDCK